MGVEKYFEMILRARGSYPINSRMAALGPMAGVAWALPSMSRVSISNFWPSSKESSSALPKAGVEPTWMVFCDSEGEVMSGYYSCKLMGIGCVEYRSRFKEDWERGYVTRSTDGEDEGGISVVGNK